MVSISYSGAEIYSIVIVGKYCQSYTDPGLNGAELYVDRVPNGCLPQIGATIAQNDLLSKEHLDQIFQKNISLVEMLTGR